MYIASENRLDGPNKRPALITLIACLELAAAGWDGLQFFKLSTLLPFVHNQSLVAYIVFPAVLTFAAIYAGVGLLQMRRSAWLVWLVRHAWISVLYMAAMPELILRLTWMPGLSVILVWRVLITVFSLGAGAYLISKQAAFRKA